MTTVSEIKAVVLRKADQSDPLNMMVVVGIRALVDGVRCGWKGTAVRNLLAGETEEGLIEDAIADLARRIIVKPINPLMIGNEPNLGADYPTVEVAE